MGQEAVLTLLKVLVMALYFAIVAFFGSLPIFSKSFKQRPMLKIIGSTFVGSLFINVALLHILPEAADSLNEFLRSQLSSNQETASSAAALLIRVNDVEQVEVFPLGYLLMMVGFLVTVFFTKVVSFHSHEDDHIEQEAAQSHQHIEDLIDANSPDKPHYAISKGDESSGNQSLLSRKKYSEGMKNKAKSPVASAISKQSRESLLKQAYLLTIAMYFHTIFEGIAVGVQNTITGFLGTAVAIAFHKWADALSMGCHYRTKNIGTKISVLLIIGQAFLNVLAIGTGMLISAQGQVVEAIFLSFSAGTFLAISTLEMLAEQLHHPQHMKLKFLIMLFGTALISAVWFVENSIFG